MQLFFIPNALGLIAEVHTDNVVKNEDFTGDSNDGNAQDGSQDENNDDGNSNEETGTGTSANGSGGDQNDSDDDNRNNKRPNEDSDDRDPKRSKNDSNGSSDEDEEDDRRTDESDSVEDATSVDNSPMSPPKSLGLKPHPSVRSQPKRSANWDLNRIRVDEASPPRRPESPASCNNSDWIRD